MSYFGTTDPSLQVRRGLVSGQSAVSISGTNTDVDTTKRTLHATGDTSDINQAGLEGTPVEVEISSSSTADDVGSTGLTSVLVSGLDASGDAQSEVIALDGQAPVTTIGVYSAIYSLRGLAAGSGDENAGVIYAGSGVHTAGVPTILHCTMEIGKNASKCGYYVVPAGKTLYLTQHSVTNASTAKTVRTFVESSTDGDFWTTDVELSLPPGGMAFDLPGVPGLAAGTHLKLTAVASNTATNVTVILHGTLVDD